MANLGSLTYDLVANIERFEKGLTRAERVAQKRTRSIQKVFRGFGAAIGAALGGSALAASRQAASALGQISDQADKLGVTTDALQELRFAAEQAGVKITSFDVGFQRFTRRLADAQSGNKGLAKTFRDLNIEIVDSQGNLKSNEAVFLDFADAMAATDDQGQRVLNTFKLFDTEGVDLVRLLQQGSGAIMQFREQARQMGAVVDSALIRNADAADKKLSAMSRVISLQVNSALAELAPILISVAQAFATAATWTARFVDSLKDIGNRTSVGGLTAQLDEARAKAERLQEALSGEGLSRRVRSVKSRALARTLAEIDEVEARLKELESNAPVVAGGGGAGGNDEAAKIREQAEQKLQAIHDSLASEAALKQKMMFENVQALKAIEDAGVIDQQERLALKMDLETQFRNWELKQATDAAKKKQAVEKRDLANKQQNFRSLLSSAATTSKLMFNINKAFALSDAVLNLHSAVSGAYAVGAKLGGPPVGAAFAAIAGVAQGARIAAIAGTSFGGGSTSSASGGSAATPVASADENFGFAGNEPSRQAATEITINMGDDTLFSDQSVRNLIEAINDQIDDGVVIKGITLA